jgi:hypothetical protein
VLGEGDLIGDERLQRRRGRRSTPAGFVNCSPDGVDFEYKWTRGHRIRTPPLPSGLAQSTSRNPAAVPGNSADLADLELRGLGASDGNIDKVLATRMGRGTSIRLWLIALRSDRGVT